MKKFRLVFLILFFSILIFSENSKSAEFSLDLEETIKFEGAGYSN
jgi:hypothetical protein